LGGKLTLRAHPLWLREPQPVMLWGGWKRSRFLCLAGGYHHIGSLRSFLAWRIA